MKPRLRGSKGWNRVKAYHHLHGPKQIVLAQWTRPAHERPHKPPAPFHSPAGPPRWWAREREEAKADWARGLVSHQASAFPVRMKLEVAGSHEVAVSLTTPHMYCTHWGSLVFLYFPRRCPEQVQPGSYWDRGCWGFPCPQPGRQLSDVGSLPSPHFLLPRVQAEPTWRCYAAGFAGIQRQAPGTPGFCMGSIPELKGGWMGTSLVVQQRGLYVPSARCLGSIPGQGTRSHMPQ